MALTLKRCCLGTSNCPAELKIRQPAAYGKVIVAFRRRIAWVAQKLVFGSFGSGQVLLERPNRLLAILAETFLDLSLRLY
jgi:hypothetical protein